MKIENVEIRSLRAQANNARRHDRPNLEAIKASLVVFGQQYPIVVTEEGFVIKGNGTFAAAADLGWSRIDVVRSDLDGDKAIAYSIADNRTSDLSDFDPDLLQLNLDLLDKSGIDMSSLGFAENEPDEVDEDDGELISYSTMGPPVMAWVLIGLPTVRFGEVAADVGRLSKIPGILCETCVNGG